MKKIYSLLLVGIMVLIGGKASAADVTNPTDTLDFSVITSLDEAASTPKYGKFECGIGSASNQSMKPNISGTTGCVPPLAGQHRNAECQRRAHRFEGRVHLHKQQQG